MNGRPVSPRLYCESRFKCFYFEFLLLKNLKAAILFTGGKDSTFACDLMLREEYEISCLITLYSENKESYMLHTAAINLAPLSAKALGIPLVVGHTAGKKEEELIDLKEVVQRAKKQYGFDVLASGGIASKYQKERIEKIAIQCDLSPAAPLWGIDQGKYLRNLIERGYVFVLTSVSAEGLDQSWLGKEITIDLASRLNTLSEEFGFNPAFEGGEAETLVLDCPLFSNYRLKIIDSQIVWNGYYGHLEIKGATLEQKKASAKRGRKTVVSSYRRFVNFSFRVCV